MFRKTGEPIFRPTDRCDLVRCGLGLFSFVAAAAALGRRKTNLSCSIRQRSEKREREC